MAKVSNPGNRPITLATGHVIPAFGSLETTNDVLRGVDNANTISGLAKSGQIVVTFDADVDPETNSSVVVSIEPNPEVLAQAEADRQLAVAAAENAAAMAAVAETPAKKK